MDEDLKSKYVDIIYREKLTDFSKIALYLRKYNTEIKAEAEVTTEEIADVKKKYKSLIGFYTGYLNITNNQYLELKSQYDAFHYLFYTYQNKDRIDFLLNVDQFLAWYALQEAKCYYCGTTQEELIQLVNNRGGNLTLNDKSKRSKGTLEIDQKDPNKGYTYDNAVLACPFCNNAKSNLISDQDWKQHFGKAMREYIVIKLSNLNNNSL